ncbi:MAG: hypothetical protein HYX35_06485 [Proteobacteria bacterium]|nr:hypothetical protein [Pseudomonadota bacterium]
MKSKILSLIFILSLVIPGQNANAQIPPVVSAILSGLCSTILKMGSVPAACTTVCNEISKTSFDLWDDLTCCIQGVQGQLGTTENIAVAAFCSTACGPTLCSCAASPCGDTPYFAVNVCGSLCCNNPSWMNANVTQCLSSYLPSTPPAPPTITCAGTYPITGCNTAVEKKPSQTKIPR